MHSEIDPPDVRRLALRVVTRPYETNHYGTIFGGVILSYIDQAGFVEAQRHAHQRWVTASIERVDFDRPVHTGDIVNLYTRTERLGRTSVGVLIEVEAQRAETGQVVPVTTAHMTLVAVDRDGHPMAFRELP